MHSDVGHQDHPINAQDAAQCTITKPGGGTDFIRVSGDYLRNNVAGDVAAVANLNVSARVARG
jgi:hypothetical protein